MPDDQTQEMDITEIVERVEKLEKENSAQAEQISVLIKLVNGNADRLEKCEESIDTLAESIG